MKYNLGSFSGNIFFGRVNFGKLNCGNAYKIIQNIDRILRKKSLHGNIRTIIKTLIFNSRFTGSRVKHSPIVEKFVIHF